MMFLAVAALAGALSLNPSRTIDFETDEGTWMSVDVAPNGRTLVFELLGDLYGLDIEGGRARPLLTGPAYESQPAFSPDGSRIVFISDRSGHSNVWVANRDGSGAVQISHDAGTGNQGKNVYIAPAWSADGRYVFAARTDVSLDDVRILTWRYALDGSGGVVLPAVSPEQHMMDAVASPDGRYLYYSAREADLWSYESMWDVRRRDLASGAEDIVLTSVGGALRPQLSADGRYLAYATRFAGATALRVRDLRSGEDRTLAYPIQTDMHTFGETPTHGLLPRYAFTPDGNDIVISYGGKIRRIAVRTGQVREIPFDARVHLEIGRKLRLEQRDPKGPVRARIIQAPQPSPDGTQLAFSALGHIYRASLDLRVVAHPSRLTGAQAAEFEPVWSPDGRWIAYVTWDGREYGHLWKTRADGSGTPIRLTSQAAYYRSPVFSPDGAWILAIRSPALERTRSATAAEEEIVRMPSVGGAWAVIVSVPALGEQESSDPGNLHFTDDATPHPFLFAGRPAVRPAGRHRAANARERGGGWPSQWRCARGGSAIEPRWQMVARADLGPASGAAVPRRGRRTAGHRQPRSCFAVQEAHRRRQRLHRLGAARPRCLVGGGLHVLSPRSG